jgi:hypothetical protein
MYILRMLFPSSSPFRTLQETQTHDYATFDGVVRNMHISPDKGIIMTAVEAIRNRINEIGMGEPRFHLSPPVYVALLAWIGMHSGARYFSVQPADGKDVGSQGPLLSVGSAQSSFAKRG